MEAARGYERDRGIRRAVPAFLTDLSQKTVQLLLLALSFVIARFQRGQRQALRPSTVAANHWQRGIQWNPTCLAPLSSYA